jgi:hypothetical protein
MVAAYDWRLAELQAEKYLNPGHIIERYREIAGLPLGQELPRGVSFSRMIETIADYETSGGELPESLTRAVAESSAGAARV